MRRTAVVAAVLVLVAGGIVFWLLTGAGPQPLVPASPDAASSAEGGGPANAPGPPAGGGSRSPAPKDAPRAALPGNLPQGPGALEVTIRFEPADPDPFPGCLELLLFLPDSRRHREPIREATSPIGERRARFGDLPSGRFKAFFVAPGCGTTGLPFLEVPGGGTAREEIVFQTPAELVLKMTLRGEPLAGAPVQVWLGYDAGPLSPLCGLPSISADGREAGPDLRKAEAVTDGRGEIRIRGITPGVSSVVGSCGGQMFDHGAVELAPGEKKVLSMDFGGLAIRGVVHDENGKPVRGAGVGSRLSHLPERGPSWDRGGRGIGVCGQHGRFLMIGLDPGTWTVEALAPGYWPETRTPVALAPDLPVPFLEFVLRWRGMTALHVRLADSRGAPYVADSVDFGEGSSGKQIGNPVPGDPGLYRIENVGPGIPTWLAPRIAGRIVSPERRVVRTPEGDSPVIDFTVSRPPSVRGRVLGPDGTPWPGAAVALVTPSEADRLGLVRGPEAWVASRENAATTGPDGTFRVVSSERGDALVAAAESAEGVYTAVVPHVVLVNDVESDVGDVRLRRAERKPLPWEPCAIRVKVSEGPGGEALRGRETTWRIQVATEGGGACGQGGFSTLDGAGRFEIPELPPGVATLAVVSDGYVPAKREGIGLAGGQSVDVEMVLEPFRESLRGVLEGLPPPEWGKRVTLSCSGTLDFGSWRLDSIYRRVCLGRDGGFVFLNLPPGLYCVSAEADVRFLPLRFSVLWAPDRLPAGTRVPGADRVLRAGEELRVRLVPGACLEGRVIFEDGSPAAGCEVWADPEQGPWHKSVPDSDLWQTFRHRSRKHSDEQGKFRIEGIPAGTYRVLAPKGTEEIVAVREGETRSAIVLRAEKPDDEAGRTRLRGRVNVNVHVVMPGGEAAPGASVWLAHPGLRMRLLGTTDAQGRLLFEGAVEGEVLPLVATCAGAAPSAETTLAPSGPGTQADLFLRRCATVSGRISVPGGFPVNKLAAGARLFGQPLDPPFEWPPDRDDTGLPFFCSAVDDAGGFEIRGLPPGRFQVFVYVPSDVLLEMEEEPAFSLGAGTVRFVDLSEAGTARVQFDLAAWGEIRFRALMDEAEREKINTCFQSWPATGQGLRYPPEMPPRWVFFAGSSREAEQRVIPGTYAAAFRVHVESGVIWLVKEAVQVNAGSAAGAEFSHDPHHGGILAARLLSGRPGTMIEGFGIFLWRDGVRVLARPDRKGSIRMDQIPPGTYNGRLVRGWWEELAELAPVEIADGKVADLGSLTVD